VNLLLHNSYHYLHCNFYSINCNEIYHYVLTKSIQFTCKFKIILMQIQFSQSDLTESLMIDSSSNIYKYCKLTNLLSIRD